MLTHPEDHVIDYYPHQAPDIHDGSDATMKQQTTLKQAMREGVAMRWSDVSVVGHLSYGARGYAALSMPHLCLLIREMTPGNLLQPDLILTYTAPKAPSPIFYQLSSPRQYTTHDLVLSLIRDAEQGWDHEVRRYLGWEHSEWGTIQAVLTLEEGVYFAHTETASRRGLLISPRYQRWKDDRLVWYGVNQYGLRSYLWPYEKVGAAHPEWLPLIEQFEACEQRFADRYGENAHQEA